MAVELSDLHEAICSEYDIKLLTSDYFNKKISWMHVMEVSDFTYLLHGQELIFNSSLDSETEENRKEFIDKLSAVEAGGLIVALQDNHILSEAIIDYCNQIQFPVFRAGWETSYLDVMHKFSEILLNHERNETNLIAALKNAIFYPDDDKLYLSHFERNGFFEDMAYVIIVLGGNTDDTVFYTQKLVQIEKSFRYIIRKCITYEEKGVFVILAAKYYCSALEEVLGDLCRKYPELYIGIGSTEHRIQDIYRSYKNAYTAYRLICRAMSKRLLFYDELGMYQILTDVKECSVYPEFVRKTLGSLIDYDRDNGTQYLEVLECFFDNECSLQQTAKALFYHKNTLKYKMKAIREILNYDISANANRVKIITAFYIQRLGNDFFEKL